MKLTETNFNLRARMPWIGALPSVGGLLLILLLTPAPACAAYQPDLLVKLASEGDAAYLGGALFETAAQLQSKSQAAFPGTPASYRVLLKNAGDLPDSFLVRGTGDVPGATVRFSDSAGNDRSASFSSGFATLLLAPGESLEFQVQVTPTAFRLGASFRVSVDAASTKDPGRIDQVKMETVACGSTAALVISAPADRFGTPGSVINYPYTVTNVGNTANSFSLSVTSASGWPAAIYADDGAGGGTAGDGVRQPGEVAPSASTGALDPGQSYRFFVEVTVPAGGVDGAHADTGVSAAGGGASGSDQVTTSAVAAAVTVTESVRNLTRGGAFAPKADALPGDTLEYRMAVTNSGSLPATSLGISSAVPASTTPLPASLWVGSSASGEGSACAAALCGWIRLAGGSIVGHLGEGASEAAGGSLPAGKTLYVYFRAQVE